MTRRRFHNLEAVRTAGEAPNAETAFFLAAFTFGLAMLSLFAVVAIAGFVEILDILPFFALPLVLFAASALVVRRWLIAEGEKDGRSGSRPSLVGGCSAMTRVAFDGLDIVRRANGAERRTRWNVSRSLRA